MNAQLKDKVEGRSVPPAPARRTGTRQFSSKLFVGLALVVAAFQLALALGAPWGRYAMGGAFPGTFPLALRITALAQILMLALAALVVISRAGLALPSWRRASRWLTWLVAAFSGLGWR